MNETKKMMEIIHQNRNKVYQANLQKEIRKQKAEKKVNVMMLTSLIVMIFLIGFAYTKWNEKQIKNCIEAGHSENFCRYDGE